MGVLLDFDVTSDRRRTMGYRSVAIHVKAARNKIPHLCQKVELSQTQSVCRNCRDRTLLIAMVSSVRSPLKFKLA